jgi:DNA-binding HxlR family transcriptional regulator
MERSSAATATLATGPAEPEGPVLCPYFHVAVELVGRRWTGAIVAVLLEHGALRFRQIAQAVPDLSDRLLAQRLRELEARGMVLRTELPGRPVGVQYELTAMGRDLHASIAELTRWAQHWLR